VTTNILTCCANSLSSGGEISFQMSVKVPETWQPSDGPINNGNFPVSADGYNAVLGNLVQTTITPAPPAPLNSNLLIDLSGLKINDNDPSLNVGESYTGTFTCSNVVPGNAPASPASCDINNLPEGITVTGCTKGGSTWVTQFNINLNEVVTCTVSGTPTSSISREYLMNASSNAANNINNDTNQASMPFYVYNQAVAISATLNNSPVLSPVGICCGSPVVVYDLPIVSDLSATYEILSSSGNVQCRLNDTNGKTTVKLFGRPGSCIVQGTKDGQISAPLVLQSN
jgi:hypothetical protein